MECHSSSWPSFLPDVPSGSPAVVALYSSATLFCCKKCKKIIKKKKNLQLKEDMFVHCLYSMLEGSCEAVSYCC